MDKKFIDLKNAMKEATLSIENLGIVEEVNKDGYIPIKVREILSEKYNYTDEEIDDILLNYNSILILP